MAAILWVLSRTLKSNELEMRYLSFLNVAAEDVFCHVFRLSVHFTVHDALFSLQKFSKLLHF